MTSQPPFLTVITRTRGDRATLSDTLTCLAAQDDDDLEVRLMLNSDDEHDRRRVEDLLTSFDSEFADRVHLHVVPDLHRVRPLNDGLDAAAGRYVSVLDDDDLVFGDWVRQFKRAASEHDGMVLRCRAVDQHVASIDAAGNGVLATATSGFSSPYRPTFDLPSHLIGGQTPQGSVAFPVEALRRLDLRFDESMPVCEDLDFLLRAVMRLGVHDTRTYGMVYRRWERELASAHSVAADVWEASMQRIVRQLDREPLTMPPGSAGRLYQAAIQELQMNKLSEGESGMLRRTEAAEHRAEHAERRAAALAHQYSELERAYRDLARASTQTRHALAGADGGILRRLKRRIVGR